MCPLNLSDLNQIRGQRTAIVAPGVAWSHKHFSPYAAADQRRGPAQWPRTRSSSKKVPEKMVGMTLHRGVHITKWWSTIILKDYKGWVSNEGHEKCRVNDDQPPQNGMVILKFFKKKWYNPYKRELCQFVVVFYLLVGRMMISRICGFPIFKHVPWIFVHRGLPESSHLNRCGRLPAKTKMYPLVI